MSASNYCSVYLLGSFVSSCACLTSSFFAVLYQPIFGIDGIDMPEVPRMLSFLTAPETILLARVLYPACAGFG